MIGSAELEQELLAFQALLLDRPRAHDPALLPVGASLASRVEVYQYGFEARTRSALESSFPRTGARLGAHAWRQYGYDYVLEAPNPAHNLNLLGRGFPSFLASRGAPAPTVELATLEWAMVEASHHPLLPPLATLEELQPELPLAFQPSLALLPTEWRAVRLLEQPRARAQDVLEIACVFRSDAGIRVREASRWERLLYLQTQAGWSFVDAVEHLRLPPGALTELLARWARDGLLVEQGPAKRTG